MKVLTPASAISPGGLLADYFVGSSWDRWRALLKAAYAEPMSPRELELFHEVAEREPPMAPVQELWAIAGRGGGKDAIASAIATVAALGHNDFLRPGEVGTIFCLRLPRDRQALCRSSSRRSRALPRSSATSKRPLSPRPKCRPKRPTGSTS